MGIKNLHSFLKKTCPYVYYECPLSDFAFKKIAIDTSIFVCKFKTIAGIQWQDAFFQFIIKLRSLDIHPIFIFDTTFPVEKDFEKQQRIDARNRIKEKILTLELSWSMFCQCFSPTGDTSIDVSNELNRTLQTLNLNSNSVDCDWKWEHHTEFQKFLQKVVISEKELTISIIEKEMEKIRNACFVIRTEDFLWIKELLKILGIPFFQAIGEAEATCAVLNKRELVDAVLSEDTDVLAYGAPLFLHKINFPNMTVQCIQYESVLTALQLLPSQFLDFCILCGTDYNTNIPKIGPEKSFRFIKKCGNIEEIEQHYPKLDTSILNYKRVRELLDNTFDVSQFIIPFCSLPNRERLQHFAFQHNLPLDWTMINETFFRSSYIEYPKEWTMHRSNSRGITVASLLRSV